MVLIKKILKKLLSESTANGLPNIFKRESILNKVFWLIFVLLSTSLSFYYTFNAINDYFNYSVVTQIKNVYQQPLQFPAITICDDGTNANEAQESQEYFDAKEPKSVVKECKTMQDSKNCTDNPNKFFEILPYVDTKDYGTCFRFNSGKNMFNKSIPFLYSTIGGRDDFIQIVFKNHLLLKIFLHDVNLPPTIQYNNIHESYIQINFNLSYYIVIEKAEDNKLGLPYNNCYNDVSEFNLNKTIINYIKSINQRYTQVNCLKLCLELDYIEKNPCKCLNTTLGRVWRDCFIIKENMNINDCTYKYKGNFAEKSVIEKCSQYCPLECDSTIYTYSVSSTYDAKHKNTTAIRFFYKSLKVAEISQTSQTQIYDLVSNIGGIFSLFIGLSFVTLFEIAEVLIEIIFSLFQRNNTVENSENENTRIKNEIKEIKIELDQRLRLIGYLLDELKQKSNEEQINQSF